MSFDPDWSAPESQIILGGFAAAVAVLLVVMVVSGYAMKWSLRWAGAGSVGFMRANGILFLATVVSTIASVAATLSGANWTVSVPASIAGWVLAVCLSTRCGVLSGVMAYLFNFILATIGMIGVGLTVLAVGFFFIPTDFKEQLAQAGQEAAKRGGFAEGESLSWSKLVEVAQNSAESFPNSSENVVPVGLPASHDWQSDWEFDSKVQELKRDRSPGVTTPSADSREPARGVQLNPFVK